MSELKAEAYEFMTKLARTYQQGGDADEAHYCRLALAALRLSGDHSAIQNKLREVAAERDRLASTLAGVVSTMNTTLEEKARLTLSLAEFIRLYRGQVANDGSYPEHLFDALVGAADNESGDRNGNG